MADLKIKYADVEGERIYFKKGMFGYRVIQPNRNEDGSINWTNSLIGGWSNFFKLLFLLIILFLFLQGVKNMMASCNDMADNPCKYTNLDCSLYYQYQNPDLDFGLDGVGDTNEQQQAP